MGLWALGVRGSGGLRLRGVGAKGLGVLWGFKGFGPLGEHGAIRALDFGMVRVLIDCGGEHTGSRASGTPCFRLLSTLHADVCVCVNTHICIYIYMYMHTPTFTYTSVRVYLPVCLPVCLLTCGPSKHVHTYIDT